MKLIGTERNKTLIFSGLIIIVILIIIVYQHQYRSLSVDNAAILEVCKFYEHARTLNELKIIEDRAIQNNYSSKELIKHILYMDSIKYTKLNNLMIESEKQYEDSLKSLGDNATSDDSSKYEHAIMEIGMHLIIPIQALQKEILALKMWTKDRSVEELDKKASQILFHKK
ncbi:MAG: hypothetical protein WAR59_10750 [Ignavibacteriaceae bacterium]|jgi:hypothetical protein